MYLCLFLWRRSKDGFSGPGWREGDNPVTFGGAAKPYTFSEPFYRFIFLSVSA